MLTPRGWSLLVIALTQLMLGVFLAVRGSPLLSLLGLTVLLWFLAEWLRFAVRARLVLPRVAVERAVTDGTRSVATVWAGRVLSVVTRVRLDDSLALARLEIADRLPAGVEPIDGTPETTAALGRDKPVELCYRVRCPLPGPLRFEGVRLHLTDLNGFFAFTAFVRVCSTATVLPPLVDVDGTPAGSKRHNLLPPPGVHRLRRPGGGSELLDLRDYRPGDPPKQIAWKASARRDRLITKEFESDVPVRCTLFVDASHAVRLGPVGRNALAQLVALASAVAQAAVGVRDLVGLVLFDERHTSALRPARGTRHLVGLLRRLAEAARLPPSTPETDPLTLVPTAYQVASALYPELMHSGINRTPLSMFWRPILDTRAGKWVVGMVGGSLLLAFATAYYAGPILDADVWPGWLMLLVVLIVGPLGLGLLAWLFYGLSGYTPQSRWLTARRKQLAALFAFRDGLGPGGVALLQEDDRAFVAHAQRFLAEHQVHYPVSLYDARGTYRFASAEKVRVLADALARAVAHGRDNELYVLLADLFELDEHLEPVLQAVRVALARHHQVLVVCPWQPGVPHPPDERPGEATAHDGETGRTVVRGKRVRRVSAQSSAGLAVLLQEAAVTRYHRAYHNVRRAFGRLGVLVVRADATDPAQRILDRLEQVRHLGGRRR